MYKLVLIFCLFILGFFVYSLLTDDPRDKFHQPADSLEKFPKSHSVGSNSAISDNFLTDFFGSDVWVINLDRDTGRLDSVRNQFRRLGIKVKRLSAVNGNTDETVKMLKQNPENKLYPSEIGCALSHQKIWKYAVDRKVPWTLIFEDDIYIPDEVTQRAFGEGMRKAIAGDNNPQIVFFGACSARGRALENQNVTGREIDHGTEPDVTVKRVHHARCNHAYAITWRMAQEFLSRTKTYDKPIDIKTGEYACSKGYCFSVSLKDDSRFDLFTGIVKQNRSAHSSTIERDSDWSPVDWARNAVDNVKTFF
uniref:Glycosyltransferase family 25 LPS biosynthesis protein n=1 Tax=Marseillevirus LCMAC101 TaxID=2506602 RepID=A0A481YQN6_9VIRU|nr:MAG: glycosyltransferase family 25 LPS biosynthesis protein [Marseillevirus LCMAC101]